MTLQSSGLREPMTVPQCHLVALAKPGAFPSPTVLLTSFLEGLSCWALSLGWSRWAPWADCVNTAAHENHSLPSADPCVVFWTEFLCLSYLSLSVCSIPSQETTWFSPKPQDLHDLKHSKPLYIAGSILLCHKPHLNFPLLLVVPCKWWAANC